MALFTQYSLKKLLHPYYISNIILSFAWVFLRLTPPFCSYLFPSDAHPPCELEYRETEIIFFVGIVIVFRTRKQGSVSLLPYVSTACMFLKIGSWFLFGYKDPVYCLIYTVICLVHLLVLPEPSYEGPENVTYFSADDLEEELCKSKSSGKKGTTWLIEFYAAWNPASIDFASAFAEISSKYGLSNLKFGKIDVSRSPESASKYKINTSFMSKQLPALILFREGVPVTRRPLVNDKGKLVPFVMNFENVVAAFDLNNIYEECKTLLANKSGKSKVTSDGSTVDKKDK